MKKALDIILKLILTAILVMPILGTFAVFPAPTVEMYANPQAFEFIEVLMETKYIMILEALVFAIAIVCLWIKREALAALIIFPITVNIIAFHLLLDGGLVTAGAIMGNVLLLLNLYFMWTRREAYRALFKKSA